MAIVHKMDVSLREICPNMFFTVPVIVVIHCGMARL